MPTDYRLDVARGSYTGASTWNKFGYNSDLDNGVTETAWAPGGTYAVPTTASTLTVVSSSTNDDSGGTGANTIYIIGIDANRDAQEELITMDGTTPVVTTTTWLAGS